MIVTEKAGETRYLLSDGLGSVRQAMDDNGLVVVYNEFDPYGNPIVNRKSEIANPYGYTGEWWQDEVELLHLRARWYMPGTGTFLSRDAWEGDSRRPLTFNGWSYVEDNPINYTDPTGKCSVDDRNATPVSPTNPQKEIPDLDRTWLIGQPDYKKECCVKLDECDTNCCNMNRIGHPFKPNYDSAPTDTPDGYMRYWLAWEKKNPCCYRDKANCMGAALEVSYLYTQLSSHRNDILTKKKYLNQDNGYGEVVNWPDLEEGYIYSGYFKQDTSKRESPGDIIIYQVKNKDSEQYIQPPGVHSSEFPSHMVVVIDHQDKKEGGGQLCFEKQATTGFYQVKPCSDRGQYTLRPHPNEYRRKWFGHTVGFKQEHFIPKNPW